MEGWVCVSSVPAPGPCPAQIQRKMTQIYGLIGTPGAKAQPSLAGTRRSIAKRKRGLASEPAPPDPACHLSPAWFFWSQLCSGNGRWMGETRWGGKRISAIEGLP
ncbi:adipogenin isoform X1 [Sturnira hondurensis]|uniref:adipogenin isoform X1 n=1 Tax=Sturnira hondurensis TaxID=192404 RepID=UPI001879C58D|nr:adipogenin isoform X1 [Sturnira hondurensis]